jgi:branched-chain amino acid transport system substrate-binding protein
MRGPYALCALAGSILVLAGCGSSSSSSSSASTSTSSQAAAATTQSQTTAAASGAITKSTIALGSQFIGGHTGKANASLPPVVIGFTNEEGASPSFAEMSHAADASVQFINNYLGGVAGHPLKLDKCVVQTEEDGQKCAAQFLGAKVQIGNQGLTVVGNVSYYKAIAGKFPVVVSGEGGGADVTTPHVYLMDAGGAAMIGNMAQIAHQLGAKKLAIISSSNPAGKYAVQSLLTPAMTKLGLKSKVIFVSDTGTTPDYASALSAGGASSADAILVIPAQVGGCISSYDALKQLGVSKKAIATYTCYGSPWPQHVGAGAANWYFSGFTTNPRLATDPESMAWRNIMTAYGQSAWEYTGVASKELQDLLLITKFGDELGYSNIKAAAMDQKIRTYKGPGFMVPGTLSCAAANPASVGVCGSTATASTYRNGQFVKYP